ncbi:hypothetical protein ACQQ2Q_17990 [Agrobacterium sp. ES01]|uniref:hypothetical protein n=1 Tax=Agrobacterium sp. ES01 TaxID=3420714 RepID=UPI003D0EA1C8
MKPIVSDQFKRAIEAKRQEALARIERVPIAVLVWGPSPTSGSPMAEIRVQLRDSLSQRGHLADFSEDLFDPASPLSNLAQQVAQAEAYDIIFSMPSSFGAVGEIHDFARLQGIAHKLIAFVDQAHVNGYSPQSLMATQTSASCKIEVYSASDLPGCIIDKALDQVRRLQELMYLSGRR